MAGAHPRPQDPPSLITPAASRTTSSSFTNTIIKHLPFLTPRYNTFPAIMAFTPSNPTSSSDKMVNSCMAVTCDKCGKITWRGCGRHIDAVFANVPQEQRCTCPRS